jgi:Tol biopolymer transport system component
MLSAGTRLGPYEILSALGAGGMGEVYRARDTKLGRDVALKVLPESFTRDSDRVARFRREAQVLAALSHPHIGAIYGLEEANGQQFLVLELIDGETLAHRIAKGPLPVDEAVAIAQEIAEALQAAHEKGITHRDLKPANIALTKDGHVKVLDFGLAKVSEAASGAALDLANSPTLTSPAMMTGVGVILGTAAYMSPEQAKGRSADKRTDIWAFGCVLFEMLTGKRAFDGEDVSDTLANVLKSAPNWAALPASVSTPVRTLLRQCLEKDRAQRMADMAVARFLLSDSASLLSTSATTRRDPAPAWRRALPWALVATLTVGLIIVLVLWAPWRSTRPIEQPLIRLDVDLGPDVALAALGLGSITISPDGTRLAYAASVLGGYAASLPGGRARLFTRRLDQPQAAELGGAGLAASPFFSPDGLWIGFRTPGTLNKISVDGGAAVPLGDIPTPTAFAGASWSPDGSIIVGARGLLRINDGGGTPTTVTQLAPGEFVHGFPHVLPGGKAVLFTAYRSMMDVDTASVEVVSLGNQRRKTLVRGGTAPRYLPSGHLVYGNKGTLFAIPFDLDRLETYGRAVPVLEGVAYGTQNGVPEFDVSDGGTLIYRKGGGGDASELSTLHWLDGTGKKTPLRDKPGDYMWPSFSPDGKRLALSVGEQGNRDIWIYEWQRDIMARLTLGGNYGAPTWSPDGQYVIFSGVGAGGLFWTRADGAGQPQPLTQSRNLQVSPSFTPDGKRLAYVEPLGRNARISTVPVEDRAGQLRVGTPEQFLEMPLVAGLAIVTLSPDGRWLAYHSTESGGNEVYVRAFPGSGGKWQISNAGGMFPIWSRTGRELFYQSGDQIMAVSYTVNGDSFVAEKPRVWEAKLGGQTPGRRFDLAPDGKRFAVLTPVEAVQAPKVDHEVVFVMNFLDELRRRVPTGK